MTFAAIVVCQVGNLFVCRNPTRSAFRSSPLSNSLLLPALLAELALLALFVYVPPIARAFGLSPLEGAHWALLLALGPTLVVFEEARKAFCRRARLASRNC
jgi:magnesium-transporting ATPase (P-type)